MKSNFENKLILITGGTRGIGLETAKLLHSFGAEVIVTGTKDFTDYKNPFLEKINYIKCDISIHQEIVDTYDLIKTNWRTPDILINNAGVFKIEDFTKTSVNDLNLMMDVNFKGSYITTQLIVDDMLKLKKGKILNVISVAATKSFQGSSVYCASKAAQKAYCEVLREEVRNHGIDVINVYPGGTETDIWDKSTAHERVGKMMEAKDVAFGILSALNTSYNERMILEDVVLRPKKGDL